MEDRYRCLTCYESLTEDEYIQHRLQGHVTMEYVIYDKDEENN